MLMVYILVLRLIHIVSSVCWAGGAFVFFLFVEPTAKALAPTGMQFVQHMTSKRQFSQFMGISSTLTVLSGALLILQRAGGDWIRYVSSGPGLGFTIGAVVGIIVYFIGTFGIRPRAIRMGQLGQQIQAAGGPPTPEQGMEMQKLNQEMSRLNLVDFVMVAVALALMSTARFWVF